MTMISPEMEAMQTKGPEADKDPAKVGNVAAVMVCDPKTVVGANTVSSPAIPAVLPTATVEMSLFAPTINGAALLGDFSRGQDLPMKKGEDGYWRVLLELPDGDYLYQFKVQSKSWFYEQDQWVTITDPKATRVDHRTGQGVLRIRGGKVSVDEYEWKHDAVPLVKNNEMIIYELHVADFSGGEADSWQRGKFKHVIEKLDYLTDLGINCIELLPIKEYPGNYSWGYTPQYLFAVENAYGFPEDLKALVDAAHEKGIRIILDGVYNHAHTDTPLAQIDHDYWFRHEPKNKEQSWGPQYNYDFKDEKLGIMPARQLCKENIQYWVGTYHVDGLRFDAASQIESFEVMRMMSDAGRSVSGGLKPFYTVAEYLPETPELVGPVESGKPMEGCWHDQFFWVIADKALTHNELDMEAVKAVIQPQRQGFTDCTQVVNYVSNHDQKRLMPKLAESLVFDDMAFARAKFGATLVMTAVGIPMLWMGEEFGDYHSKSQEARKIDWTLLGNGRNKELHAFYKKMIKLRKENQALQRNDLEFFWEHQEDGILAFVRWDDNNKRVVVIANLKDSAKKDYEIGNMPEDGEWADWLSDGKVEVKDRKFTASLSPWETKVLVKG